VEAVARRLFAGAERMLGESDVERLIDLVLALARELTAASYAGFGETSDAGAGGSGTPILERFVASGVEAEVELGIGRRPRGLGVLGEVLRDPAPLRLADIGMHPHSYGFPEGHPSMRTFLGAPIFGGGRLIGALFVAEKARGEVFTQDDEDAIVALAGLAGTAIDNARRQGRERLRRGELEHALTKLEAMTEVNRAIGDEIDLEVVLGLVAKRGRALVGARVLLIELDHGDELLIAAGAGEVPDGLVGATMPPAGTFAQQAMAAGRGIHIGDHLGRAQLNEVGVDRRGITAQAGFVVPLLFRGRALGALLAIDRLKGGPSFTAADAELLEAFAATAATAVALARTVASDLERLVAVVHSSTDAIVTSGVDGLVTSWNPGAEALYGYPAEEVLGRHGSWIASLVIPDDRGEESQLLARVLQGESCGPIETTRVRKDGTVIDVSLSVSPIRDRHGRIAGMASIARDITERKRADRTRERALAELADAQRLARLGSWSWDPGTDQMAWSAQMYEILGREPELGPPSGAELSGYVHQDDRDRVRVSFLEVFGRASTFELDFRIVAGAGAERDVHMVGSADPGWPGGYRGTVQDVTDQRQAETERVELMAASVRAESANRAKSEFLARMSHELRTPLNSIMGFSQLIQLEGGLEQQQAKDLDLVVKASQHLMELISDVLDISRIEAGGMTISSEPVPLASAVDEAVALVGPVAAEHGIALRTRAGDLPSDRCVQADRSRLKQVLLNLLTNAIKYNRPRGTVEISFGTGEAGRIRTTIKDTGIGLRPEQLERLYQPFERLGAEQTDVEGTGLGLALSRRLVEAMGGAIEVESEPGRGTSFAVVLQAARPLVAATEPDPTAGEPGYPFGGAARRVLYIEDNLLNLSLVEEILSPHQSIELTRAMLGAVGLELAREQTPDLIILDLHLPDIPGLEVLERLKADATTRDIPTLVLTADATRRQEDAVLSLGALAYMTKPLDIAAFLAAVCEVLWSGAPGGPGG
jgi:PAS domain S-box-containing protein